MGDQKTDGTARGSPAPQRLSTLRLFTVVLLFLGLAAYAVWRSDRFQILVQGLSETRLSQAFGVPVRFQTVELRLLPPSLSLANVRIGNDPALGISPESALLTAEEVSIGGGVSLVGRELRLGRLRAVRPTIRLIQLEDGRWNLPPGLKGGASSGQGLKVEIGSLLVQQGILEFEGRKLDLDGRLEDFAAELTAVGPDLYRGSVAARHARVRLPNSEPVELSLDTRFRLHPKRGLAFDRIRLAGDFGHLEASGSIETFATPRTLFAVSGRVSIERAEQIFRSKLGFRGQASIEARVELPPGGAYRVTGRLTAPEVFGQQFPLEDVAARFVAQPEELVVSIERAGYAGGSARGSFRIASLERAPRPMTLIVEADGVSLERFFADLELPGTGLSGLADLSVALRWGPEGISRADGGGTVAIRPGPPTSRVAGRFGLPTAGGGALAMVGGRMGFEAFRLEFAQSRLEFSGGIRIGDWQPDFDFRLLSRDFAEADRLFQNFVAATGGAPEPLGLGGSGEASGRLSGRWAEPVATAQLSVDGAHYAGVPFGNARGTVQISEGSFFFRPLTLTEGDASLTLDGRAGYRNVPGRPKFELDLAARRYPLSRLLDFLDFEYPAEGLVTGRFPVAGSAEALTGGGPLLLEEALLWGQAVPRIEGRVRFSPGRFALEDVAAAMDGGTIAGGGAVQFSGEKRFDVRLVGKEIPISAIDALRPGSDLSGKLSFDLSASGSFERPDLTIQAFLDEGRFFGRAVPAEGEPRLEARMEEGVLQGSLSVPGKWILTARGEPFVRGGDLQVSLDVPDLASLLLLTPVELPPGRNGSLAIEGNLRLPEGAEGFPTGTFRVTRARLDLPERAGAIATSGVVTISLADQRLRFEEFVLAGEGTSLRIQGLLDLGAERGMNLTVVGPLDPALLAIALPDVGLTGRLVLDLAAAGPLGKPLLSGTVRVEDGKYRLPGLAQILDDINATVRIAGSRGQLEARARFGGGEGQAAGSFELDGASLESFRLSLQARRVTLRYPESMRLLVDADLVATREPGGNSIRGEVVLLRGTYTQSFDLTISDLLQRGRPAALAPRHAWKDETRLEIRIVSSEGLELRTNVARLTGTADLLLSGTVADPSLLGQMVFDEGGRITFRDVTYEIESGIVTFANNRDFAPIVDVRARAEVKGYELIVNLAGTWPRLQTSFTSDPPLPDETIVGMLLTGTEPDARTVETGTTLVSAAGGIVGGAAAGFLTRPAQRLFGLERFQIEPVFNESGFSGATTTVGKQISPNWSVRYSQPLFESGNRQPAAQIEGRLSQNWIVRLRRDENGIFLLDLRRRQRY